MINRCTRHKVAKFEVPLSGADIVQPLEQIP